MDRDPLAPLADLPDVADAVAAARKAVDAVYGHRVMRRRAPEVAAESALRGARASAACDGADWALEEVRRRTDFGSDPDARTVGAALRATAEAGPLLDTWRRAPLQVLARLHLVASSSSSDPSDAGLSDADPAIGRPRRAGELPEGHLGWPEAAAPEEAAARLDALAGLLTAKTAAPGPVVAAVVHGELAALRPFPSANGIVARAAQRLSLIAGGVDPKAICPAEVGHAELGADAYAQALRGYASGTADGVAAWIVHCAEAIRLGARETTAVCEAMQRGML
ncbi:oxidoreductase [Mangrovactinospora gilvigrisea]|uniref:Oxidoreductase n=1 Tax=Mangrovactinospora gilvigrisea TaxID=1428644 RepID=A0A1J7C8H7_9ACTN|nr:oxidoreductase [Mangrovactinospora gilvigrisea]OIV37840.1 oxidoreductase [Mangrovactinospora gilvigrisea]